MENAGNRVISVYVFVQNMNTTGTSEINKGHVDRVFVFSWLFSDVMICWRRFSTSYKGRERIACIVSDKLHALTKLLMSIRRYPYVCT